MERLSVDGKAVALESELLDAIERMAGPMGGVRTVLDELARVFATALPPADSPQMKAILQAFGMAAGSVKPLKELKELYETHKEVLGWLTSPVDELGVKEHSWPLKSGKTLTKKDGTVTLGAQGQLFVTVEADTDGEILDGAVRADREDEAFLRLGVSGKLDGNVAFAGPLGALSASAAFTSGSTVSLNNYFRHRKSEMVFDAVVADLRAFRLPAQLAPGALRARTQATGDARLVIPDQWVHLHASGYVQVAGSLSFGQSFVRSVSIGSDALSLDDSVDVSLGLAASVGYSHLLRGEFDVILSAASSHEGLLAVELAKSKTSKREPSFQVGAEIRIDGIDRVAKAVLDAFLTDVETLVESIESQVEELSDLKALFSSRLDKGVDALLSKTAIDEQIETWLKRVAKSDDLDVKSILKKIAREAGLKVVDSHIDKLQSHVDEVTDVVKDILRHYRETLGRLNAILERAAGLKVGVNFARTQSRIEQDEVALRFEVDVSQEAGKKLLARMTLGDFAEAMNRARAGDPVVSLVGGALTEEGSLDQKAELTVNVFGFRRNHASILTQEWKSIETVSGDVNISVKTQLQARHQGWSSLRTCTFLADTSLLAVVGDAGRLSGAAATHKVSLELTREWKPTIKELEELGEDARRLGVTLGNETPVKDLGLPTGGSKPFGELRASVLLELGKKELDRLAETPEHVARRVFTDALLEFFISEPRFHRFDDTPARLPILLWDSVQNEKDFIHTAKVPFESLTFRDNGRTLEVTYTRDEQIPLFFYCRLISSFGRTVTALRSLRGTLSGLTREQTLRALRDGHREVMKAAAPVVKGTLSGGHRVNYALFRTMFLLAGGGESELDPFLAIQRNADERIFVYG